MFIYIYIFFFFLNTHWNDWFCLGLIGNKKGCDASVIIASTPNNQAEKDHPDNLSLAGDGFDTVIKAKAAVDAVASCRNKVSCADILAMAARDVIALVSSSSLVLMHA